MIKKRLLEVVESYVTEAEKVVNQLSIRDFVSGTLTLYDLNLKSTVLQDMYGSYLPVCTEVIACHVDKLQLAVPWISLSSSPSSVEVQQLTLKLRLRCPTDVATCTDPEEVQFWQEQAERLASAKARFEELCTAGAKKPPLLDRVLGGLNVEVKRLRLELWRPEAISPAVVGDICKLHFRPMSQDWQPLRKLQELWTEMPDLSEVKSFTCLDIENITLETPCGGSKAVLAPLKLKMLNKMPAQSPLLVPFACTMHKIIELGNFTVAGSEDPTAILLAAVNDIYCSFSMVDHNGLLLHQYLPDIKGHSEPKRNRDILAQMHRKTVVAVESLVNITRRASAAGQNHIKSFEADPSSKLATVKVNDQTDDTETSDEESFQDAMSDNSDIEPSSPSRPKRLDAELSSPMQQTWTHSTCEDGRPMQAPVAALGRKTVSLRLLELRVSVPKGELVLRLDSLSFVADAALPMSQAARKCCADLFEVLVDDGADPPLGQILSQLGLQAAEVQFHSKQPEGGAVEPLQSNGGANAGQAVGSCAIPSKSLVLRLPTQSQLPLKLTKHGPGGPVPCGELQAEPQELLITGLQMQVGQGLDELRAWWARLQPELSQLPDPPRPELPPSCTRMQFLQTTVVQEPTDDNALTLDGGWPLQITLPTLEARSVSNTLDLPHTVHALLSVVEDFEARSWWLPLFVPTRPARDGSGSENTDDDKEAQLLTLQGALRALELENAKLRSQVAKAHTVGPNTAREKCSCACWDFVAALLPRSKH